MLCAGRIGVVVIEAHSGLIARAIGTQWEMDGDAVNYVFRWNRSILEQATRSYLLQGDAPLFDHNLVVNRMVSKLPESQDPITRGQGVYGLLHFAAPMGNMLVGIVLKRSRPFPQEVGGALKRPQLFDRH
jgi:hypothetical protein